MNHILAFTTFMSQLHTHGYFGLVAYIINNYGDCMGSTCIQDPTTSLWKMGLRMLAFAVNTCAYC